MESYIVDWLSLIFRWLHVITAIAWIGASFYFIWLDNSLENPPEWKKSKGIKGDLWAIHGGGIYEVGKYQLAPERMPATLHWFKWEAYSTWLTGMALLSIIYYVGADSYLIDKRVADLSPWQAIAIGLSLVAGSWVFYEVLCRSPVGRNAYIIGAVLICSSVLLSYGLTQIFSGRGAYIHMGAVIGTIMAGNVFRVIMPSQKALIEAIVNDEIPDPSWGAKAKLHSTHNTYLTLPLIFIMISSHYPFTYSHHYNWAILLVIMAITAIARQYFVLRHKHIIRPGILFAAAVAVVILAFLLAPKHKDVAVVSSHESSVHMTQVTNILISRCASCHSTYPTDDVFKVAPAGVTLDILADMQRWMPRIKARVIETTDMPFMNKTNMTEQERTLIAAWIRSKSAD